MKDEMTKIIKEEKVKMNEEYEVKINEVVVEKIIQMEKELENMLEDLSKGLEEGLNKRIENVDDQVTKINIQVNQMKKKRMATDEGEDTEEVKRQKIMDDKKEEEEHMNANPVGEFEEINADLQEYIPLKMDAREKLTLIQRALVNYYVANSNTKSSCELLCGKDDISTIVSGWAYL